MYNDMLERLHSVNQDPGGCTPLTEDAEQEIERLLDLLNEWVNKESAAQDYGCGIGDYDLVSRTEKALGI
jgi:hypothetical protein